LHELGAEAYAEALAEHRRIVREAFARQGGVEVDTQGDAFFVAFPTAPGALAAAAEMLEGLSAGPIRLRMGLHTGTPHVAEEGYVGVDVHRAARIAASGHGGQVLVSASTAALTEPGSLRDLGEHRLKDLSAPERIYQLGDGDFPELTTLYRTNLPVPATPFLGRDRELAEVLGLLGGTRLLTLTGPGGTGKTRLGLQAAAEASERFPDGVFWVPLASLRDPELVLEAAGQALGAQDGTADYVGDRQLLLLLDNFEHVVDAAADVSGLLAACPNLQLLVTSREVLRVPGEQAYAVPPLEPSDGEELFNARARATRPDFVPTPAVAELCARLDNLPLALELAAARVRVLSPEQLLERLAQRLDLLKAGRGVDPRQQTLRATIEWSHELLDADEQRLFARLAVFRGGCTLEAAEAICEADVDTLESLVDKSLVRVREGDRFWMLETIREYAEERLAASDEADELRRRHAEHFLALAEQADPVIASSDPGDWIDRLEDDYDNLRAALDFLEGQGDTGATLRLAAALRTLWFLRGRVPEGRRRLEAALAADESPTIARARALSGASTMASMSGDVPAAKARSEEALALARELGDDWGIAEALWTLGYLLVEEGRSKEAVPLIEEGLRVFEELGDEHHALHTTRTLAFAYDVAGELERARVLHERNLERARALGNRQVQVPTLGALAMIAVDQERFGDALAFLRENLPIAVELGNRAPLAVNLCRIAHALAAAGRPGAAARLLAALEEPLFEIGGGGPWVTEMNEQTLELVRARLDPEALAAANEEGRALSFDEAVELALAELQE
jgi:predicted ATPase